MKVIDASAAVELALASRLGEEVHAIVWRQGGLAAPEVMDLEFIQSLRRLVRVGSMTEQRALEARAYLDDMPIDRHRHRRLGNRIWELRHGFTAYDASYVALAEMLDADLITCDAPLARAVAGLGLDVECELIQ